MSKEQEKEFVSVGIFGVVYPYSLGNKLAHNYSDRNYRRISIYRRQACNYPFQFVDVGYEASIKNMFRVVCLSDYAIISYRIGMERWQKSYKDLVRVLINSSIRKAAILVDYQTENVTKFEFERDVEKIRKELECDDLDRDLNVTFIPMRVWSYLQGNDFQAFSWFEGGTINEWIEDLTPKSRFQALRQDPQTSMLVAVAAHSFLYCKVLSGVFELNYDWKTISVFERSSYEKIILNKIWIGGDHYSDRKIGPGQFFCLGKEDFSTSDGFIGGLFGDYFNQRMVSLPLEETRCAKVETFWIGLDIENNELWHAFRKNPTIIVRCGLKKVKCQILDFVEQSSKKVVLRLSPHEPELISKNQKRKFDSYSQYFYTKPFEKEPTLGQCLVLTFRKRLLVGLGKVLKVVYFSNRTFFIDNCMPFFEKSNNIPYTDISILNV